MDKALPSGGRDCGFESRLGLPFLSVDEACGLGRVVLCSGYYLVLWTERDQKSGYGRGDARIELATSCTLSKNHTTRPITRICREGHKSTFYPPSRQAVSDVYQTRLVRMCMYHWPP